MEKVIIDIDLLMEWSTAISQENVKSTLALLHNNNFQAYIFDFQAKLFDVTILKSKLKGIRINIIEKEAYTNALSLASNYEAQFKVKLNEGEKISFLSYAGCGFTGIRYFLRKSNGMDVLKDNSELSNKFLTFNIELVKI